MIFMPPRSGKSQLVSRQLPAFLLGQNPDTKLICCSHTATLSSAMNRDVQRIIDSPEYGRLFPGTTLNQKNVRHDASGGWLRNNEVFEPIGSKGYYRSAGVGGGITGLGFDVGVIDDPVKDAEEASSPTMREKVWDWYTSTFYTRRQPGAKILITLTRWDVDDLAGRLLRLQEEEPGSDRWEVLSLPAISSGRATSPDDPRKEGEPLWPENELFDLRGLEKTKATVGHRVFAALYQQEPTDEGGNHFKEDWFGPQAWEWSSVESPRDSYRISRADGTADLFYTGMCPRFVIVDPAASERETADYTAIGVFAQTPTNDLLCLDMVRERLGIDRIVPKLLDVCQRWRPEWVGMEATGFQVALCRQAQKTVGIPAVRELSHDGKGKLVRATPAIIKAEARQILLPRPHPEWVKPLLEELVSVRLDGKDAHDDQADCLAYAVVGMGTGSAGATVVDNRSRDRGRR